MGKAQLNNLSLILATYRRLPVSVRAPVAQALAASRAGALISYSASGEDLLLAAWLQMAGVPRRDVRYLDVGASHPRILSNTYLFYRSGASGVLVEPNRHEGHLISQTRPRDTLLAGGVAFDDRRDATLFEFTSSVFNTFDEQAARDTMANMPTEKIIGKRSVALLPISEIADKYFKSQDCHILSIDAEGVDGKILASIDFTTFRPWSICIETVTAESLALLNNAGYTLLSRTPSNSVFWSR
ncbi:FkbM family methyltransferase [Devosia faecipullorum]|uniref:FkbM family methyltransferase n=1 Tax=Devosia faecipullorum TaxID=2755039 RepID=UPI00187B98AD|nr:FkbM family methyltransferase [Devosia faecipullorum]MBE7734535.1 FkbM family methyltransferase [Devosia faecipullorum]